MSQPQPTDSLTATFAALADPTRRAILARLTAGEASVGELAAPFQISLPAVSRHLKVLEAANLIIREKDAQRRVCRFNPDALDEAGDWIAVHRSLWEEGLNALDAYLAQVTKTGAKK